MLFTILYMLYGHNYIKISRSPQNEIYWKEKLKHCADIRNIWVQILAVYSSTTWLCYANLSFSFLTCNEDIYKLVW